MKALNWLASAALVVSGVCVVPSVVIPSAAQANKHHHGHGHHHHHNRRKARRAGVVAGIAAAGVAGAIARDNARDEYRDCMDHYEGNPRYERYCREDYYDDRRRARRTSRRVGVVTGLTVREIVRD